MAEFASGTLPRPAVKSGRSDFRCFRSQFRSRRQTLPRKFPRPPTLGLLFRLCVRQGPDRALVNRAAVRLGRAASIPRARAHHAHWGRNEKPDLCAAATCTKVRPYLAFAAIPNGCKGRFRSFGRFRFASGLRPEAAISQSWIRLLLFLGSLLCDLLGGCLRGFLCLLCFLGHVVLFEKWLSEHAHAEYRHAQRRNHITNAELIPTHREVVIESLAGGTRSRAPPSLHAGVAITVPRSGALLTGLATAVGPASRRVPRRRYADAPAAASFSWAWLAPTNRSLPFVEKLMGSAPRARQGKAPANAGADPSGIPGLPRFLTS